MSPGSDKLCRYILSFLHFAATDPKNGTNMFPWIRPAKMFLGLHLSKTLSFLVSHKDQQKAAAPASNNKLKSFPHCLYQFPKMFSTVRGGVIPNTICNARQRIFAYLHSKNRCWIVSKLLQKQQYLLPCQFLLAMLSLVSITPFLRNQRKILILSGSLMSLVMRYLCIDLTVKLPLLLKVHVIVSFPACRFTFAIVVIRLFHSNNLFPISALLKETLRGIVLNTSATVACFFANYVERVWEYVA